MAFAEISAQRGTAHNLGTPGFMDLDFPVNVTAGSLLPVCGVWWRSGGASGTLAVSDDLSPSYDELVSDPVTLGTGTYRFGIAYGVAGSSGANHVQFAYATDSYAAVALDEFTGQHATPLSVSTTTPQTGTSTTPSFSITTLTAGELIIVLMSHGNSANPTFSVDSPATEFGHSQTADVDMPLSAAFLVAGAAGSYAIDFTLGASSAWATFGASFRAADGAVVTPPTLRFGRKNGGYVFRFRAPVARPVALLRAA